MLICDIMAKICDLTNKTVQKINVFRTVNIGILFNQSMVGSGF